MAEAQSISTTPEQLPQKLAKMISQRLEDSAQSRAAVLESQRRDQLVRAQSKSRLNVPFSPEATPSVRPLQSAGVTDTPMSPSARPIEERLQMEKEHEAKMLLNRQEVRRQMKIYHESPLTVAPLIDEPGKTKHGIRDVMKSYASQYQGVPEGSPIRAKIRQEVGKKMGELVRADIKGIAGKKIGNKIITWIWRVGSDGTVLEWEGVMAWVVTIFGACVWGVRFLVTIFRPKSPSWLKYAAFDLKDPVTWAVDLPYGIMAVLIILAIFIIVMAILIIVGAFLASMGILAEYFGFIDLF